MKKVLIISYFWPYCAGSKRTFGLAKYLSAFGWQPVILTGPLREKPDPSFQYIETGYEGFLGLFAGIAGVKREADVGDQIQDKLKQSSLRRSAIARFAYNAIKELFAYPDEHKRWAPFALAAARTHIREQGVDALMSIWPFTGHCVARTLKEEYNLPWVADFPDLWSDNAAYPYSRMRRWVDRKLERRILKSADLLTTSSDAYARKLNMVHSGKRIVSVLMGFDPDLLNVPPAPLTKTFTITYTGMLYQGKRTPTKFLRALSELIARATIDPAHVEVRLYGSTFEETKREITDMRLGSVVRCYPAVPLRECVERQRESQVLLQLNWEDQNDKGVFSGKMLDYLAAQRPILAVGGFQDDIVGEWLDETRAGVRCLTVEDTKKALLDFYRQWRQNGRVAYYGIREKVDEHSNLAMARRFSSLLSRLIPREII